MKPQPRVYIYNRKAKFNYFLMESYVAGIVLKGNEIKSIRNGGANMDDSYCTFENGELFIKNLHISPYKNASAYQEYDPKRDRKLLLTKRELRKLKQGVDIKGNTIIPYNLFTNENGLVKLEIYLAKGKHTYDKSQAIKERDLDREMKNF